MESITTIYYFSGFSLISHVYLQTLILKREKKLLILVILVTFYNFDSFHVILKCCSDHCRSAISQIHIKKQLSMHSVACNINLRWTCRIAYNWIWIATQAIKTLDFSTPWSGRFWARTFSSVDSAGKFVCQMTDWGSGKMSSYGTGGRAPASLSIFTLGGCKGKDFHDISLVDGFNLPISITPQAGSRCKATGCQANMKGKCPRKLAIRGASRSVIACKSACVAFNQPQYCCTSSFGSPNTCKPTSCSKLFKRLCPQAYSYAYNDKSSTFTCNQGGNYIVTFCPWDFRRESRSCTENIQLIIKRNVTCLDEKISLPKNCYHISFFGWRGNVHY